MSKTDLRRVCSLDVFLVPLHSIICTMQQQSTPNLNDKIFYILKFYEVGQMKD